MHHWHWSRWYTIILFAAIFSLLALYELFPQRLTTADFGNKDYHSLTLVHPLLTTKKGNASKDYTATTAKFFKSTATTAKYLKSEGVRPSMDLDRPMIVVWAKQFHPIDWTFPELSNGDGGCDISFDRKDIDRSDAVVFFMKSCKPKDLPDAKNRRKNQVYVWWSHESPWTVKHYYRHSLTEYNNYFNWTMTYRTDSDVVAAMWPTPAMDYLLFRVGRKDEMLDPNLADHEPLSEEDFQTQAKHLISLKSKLVAWVVSDCSVTSGARVRTTMVDNLEKKGDLSVERFGKCANNPIPFVFPKLFQTLAPFKFYLALENSLHCRDYVTEKTAFNCLVGGSVPVIHGPTREHVAKILPEGSYIHVEHFDDLSDLGRRLKYLDRNDTAYMEYFKWWKTPGAHVYPRFGFNYGPSYVPRIPYLPQYSKQDVQDDWLDYERFGMYHLCRKLKRGDHISTTKIIPSLAEVWFGKENKECYE